MRDDLLQYYERELGWLRRMGADFAQRYPKVASRLQLEPTKCEDPHVERVLEAFAFLAARVHLRIDDDLPEISQSLLDVVYPHYVRPIPSMSLVEFRLDPEQGKLTTGFRVPRDSTLYSRAVDGVPCRFSTCYDTTLWPVTVSAVQWTAPDRLRPAFRAGDAVAALRIELRCLPDVTFDKLDLKTLRLHLNGDSTLVTALYELLCNNARQIVVRELGSATPRTVTLPAGALRPVGFARDEGMLPYSDRSFLGYRLLQEYFAFPEKYLFLDLSGFDKVRAAGMRDAIEILVPVSSFERGEWHQLLESGVSASTIRLGCTPIINLFPQTSEPVLLTQRRHEYPLVADARRRLTTDIYSIDSVTGVGLGGGAAVRFEPLHGSQHSSDGADAFWTARRQHTGWRTDEGTEMMLSFRDLRGTTAHPDLDVVTARLTCFNGDLPSRLPFGQESGDFELEGGGPIRAIVALVKPTKVTQPPLGGPLLWRLVSLFSLNYLSISDSGAEGLREILRLHEYGNSPSARKQIDGVLAVSSAPAFARVNTEHGLAFARGRRVELSLDEEQFAGGGVYLFASVIERFLGLYASLNSFSILAARTSQRKAPLREWPARAGWKALL